MNDKIIFLFVGPPGCGKGTQGNNLAEYFGKICLYFEMGQYLRDRRARDTSFDQLCREYNMDDGGYLPIGVLKEVVQEKIDQFVSDPISKFLILDGYPRTPEQLETLSNFLKEKHKCLRIFSFIFELNEEECVRRIIGRYTSSGRSDDREDTAKERYKKYEDLTLPMIEQLYSFFDIGGERIIPPGTIEQVFQYIITIINNLKYGYLWMDGDFDDVYDN